MRVRYASFLLVVSLLGRTPEAGASAQVAAPEWPPTPPALDVERLGNGVRVAYLPKMPTVSSDESSESSRSVEIAFGYAVDAPANADEHAAYEAVRLWMSKSVPARTAELIAHLGGGRFEWIANPDLVGLRVSVDEAHVGSVLEQATRFLDQRVVEGPLLDYVFDLRELAGRESPPDDGDAVRIVVSTLLAASDPGDSVGRGETPEAPGLDPADVVGLFRRDFGTDRAWVIVSTPQNSEQLEPLNQIVERVSLSARPVAVELESQVGGEIRLSSRPRGRLVVGSRVSGVHYEGWFHTLLVDRALRRRLDGQVRFEFGPSRSSTVHLIEQPVAFPAYARDEVAVIMSRAAALQTELVSTSLPQIKRDALAYLGSRNAQEWFVAQDLWSALEDGWTRVWNLTAEQFRAAVDAFLREVRVVAMSDPAVERPSIVVEELGTSPEVAPVSEPLRAAPGRVEVPELPEVRGPARMPIEVEKLQSGVTLAGGPPAIFVAGPFASPLGGQPRTGPNGTLWTFTNTPGPEVFELLREVRPDRLLFFLSTEDRNRFRQFFASWSSGDRDATDATGAGPVATADLPALVILKVWLDRKVIEAGWSGEVDVRIAGTEGARLAVDADAARRTEIDLWLAGAKDAFAGAGAEQEFRQLRAAAGAYFDRIRRDLEVLLWQRAPDGRILPPDSVSLARFRNLLTVYF